MRNFLILYSLKILVVSMKV